MIEEPISVKCLVTTFLAVTEIKPREQKKFRRTIKEKERIKQELIDILKEDV